jgi:hypothetical protein
MKPGDFFGPYSILKPLGKGAMGIVYLARNRDGRELALKTILEEALAQSGDGVGFRLRFEREAKLAASVDHPNVVKTYDFGEVNSVHYLACELVKGGDLEGLLKKSGGCLAELRSLMLVWDILHGLSALEAKELVHRDIKPANILLTEKGRAKISDLGLARSTNSDRTMLTQAGQILGTPLYMSPEQIEGRPDLDIRCDLYATGAMLYHMLAGTPPFSNKKLTTTLKMHLRDKVPNICDVAPGVGAPVDKFIKALMAKDREDRPKNAMAALAMLEKYCTTLGTVPVQAPMNHAPPMKTMVMGEAESQAIVADLEDSNSLEGATMALGIPAALGLPSKLTPLGQRTRALSKATIELEGTMGIRTLFLYAQEKLQIGRNAVGQGDQDICLRHKPALGNEDLIRQISGKHFGLFVSEDKCWIRDLGSRHGTALNGQDLPKAESRFLGLKNDVSIARNLELKVTAHSTGSQPPAIGSYGTVSSAPAIHIERLGNGTDHSYALICGRLGLSTTPAGEMVPVPSKDAQIEFLNLGGQLWVAGQGIESDCCQALEPGLQFKVGSLIVKVAALRPEHQKD